MVSLLISYNSRDLMQNINSFIWEWQKNGNTHSWNLYMDIENVRVFIRFSGATADNSRWTHRLYTVCLEGADFNSIIWGLSLFRAWGFMYEQFLVGVGSISSYLLLLYPQIDDRVRKTRSLTKSLSRILISGQTALPPLPQPPRNSRTDNTGFACKDKNIFPGQSYTH